MSKDNSKWLVEKLSFFLKGNHEAVRLCLDLVCVAHLWDDLIDKDVQRSDSDINNAFFAALINVPSNQFFSENRHVLLPVMTNSVLRWKDANVLEKGSDHDKHLAFGHRAGMVDIFAMCALIIGGTEWAEQVGPDIRRMYEEDLFGFMKEMENA